MPLIVMNTTVTMIDDIIQEGQYVFTQDQNIMYCLRCCQMSNFV